MADVSVTRQIAAPPEVVWSLVSDLPRMGEWSPENTGGTWLGDATGPEVGARFEGDNENDGRTWSTVATVTEANGGRSFEFDIDVLRLLPIARWRFDIERSESGCTVTESWTDRRPGWFTPIGTKLTGVPDRAEHSRDSMRQTLDALAAEAETAG
ncbi:SRPBCC family protein [Ilumatobacter sp.]|uniref:SRPBCC family protein n=1 Tax=Ilumatobacter sp. TaxID=1967498 RepID=UPI003B51B270